MATKIKFKDVEEYFKKLNLELLTNESEYKNSNTVLSYVCECGEIAKVTFSDFKRGRKGCQACRYDRMANKNRVSFEIVKKVFEDNNCILLSDEYISAKSPLEYICSCGNQSVTTYDVMKKGHKCKECGDIRKGLSHRIPYNEIYAEFEKRDCILLTTENDYDGVKSIVEYVCSCGNTATVTVDAFMHAQEKCMKCASKRRSDTCIEKYGVSNPMQDIEIKKKSLVTAYENGTFPTSSQQLYIHSIIGGELNYPVNISSLDIAFPDYKIYLEYNGGMHDGAVKFGSLTREEFNNQERRRRYSLFNRGWKEIRIESKKDRLPRESTIKEMITFAFNYLENHHWIEFNIDENRVKSSQFNNEYDFKNTFIFLKNRHSHLISKNMALSITQ